MWMDQYTGKCAHTHTHTRECTYLQNKSTVETDLPKAENPMTRKPDFIIMPLVAFIFQVPLAPFLGKHSEECLILKSI